MGSDVTFGKRLRQLRQEAKMSQRDLAAAVKLDFTYLSKIENGKMAPPSEEAILNMARELETDSDELLQLARIVPSDLKPIISNQPGLPDFLRSISDFDPMDMSRLMDYAQKLKSEREGANQAR